MYTFAQPLNRALRTASESPAVVCQDNRRTYAELGSRCLRLAGAMHKLGLAPHDRVGVIGLNSDRYLELYLALPAAGYVLVPVNSRLAPAEMRAILDDAGVSVLFADADYPGAAGVSQVLTMPDDYEDLIAAADETPLGDGVDEDDLAALFYTSGTTGVPKGAMHTHRGLVSSALHFMATWPFDRHTRWLVASPMFHTGGILATLATVWAGGTHVIMPRFDPDLAVDLIEREAVTHTLLVPAMLAAAAGAQLARPRNVSSLRYLSHGPRPFPPRRSGGPARPSLAPNCCTSTARRKPLRSPRCCRTRSAFSTPRSSGHAASPPWASRYGSSTAPWTICRRARSARSPCAAPASWPVTGASRTRRPRSCAATGT